MVSFVFLFFSFQMVIARRRRTMDTSASQISSEASSDLYDLTFEQVRPELDSSKWDWIFDYNSIDKPCSFLNHFSLFLSASIFPYLFFASWTRDQFQRSASLIIFGHTWTALWANAGYRPRSEVDPSPARRCRRAANAFNQLDQRPWVTWPCKEVCRAGCEVMSNLVFIWTSAFHDFNPPWKSSWNAWFHSSQLGFEWIGINLLNIVEFKQSV